VNFRVSSHYAQYSILSSPAAYPFNFAAITGTRTLSSHVRFLRSTLRLYLPLYLAFLRMSFC
jgi:hypothetical protein